MWSGCLSKYIPFLSIPLSLTEFFLYQDIKNLNFSKSWEQVYDLNERTEDSIPIWVSAGFKSSSELYGFTPTLETKVVWPGRLQAAFPETLWYAPQTWIRPFPGALSATAKLMTGDHTNVQSVDRIHSLSWGYNLLGAESSSLVHTWSTRARLWGMWFLAPCPPAAPLFSMQTWTSSRFISLCVCWAPRWESWESKTPAGQVHTPGAGGVQRVQKELAQSTVEEPAKEACGLQKGRSGGSRHGWEGTLGGPICPKQG